MTQYVIESFICEYNVNKEKLNELYKNYYHTKDQSERMRYESEFKLLYPEQSIDSFTEKSIEELPETISKKVYFIQSPTISTTHSLKAKMLNDLRAKRKQVKKQMAEAEERGDKLEVTRLNSKQLAIKIIMNTEYGASANKLFANYDPDVAGAVTNSARELIHFVTTILESSELFVDDNFIKSNSETIELLTKVGCIKSVTQTTENSRRTHTLQRIYNKNNSYKIVIEPSKVLYQDTDSNYYKNNSIINYYMQNPNPDNVLECMKTAVKHTKFMAKFVDDVVNRKPVGVEFDCAFLICRYLNRKKKYYGVKWTEKIKSRLDDKAYNDGILINDYDQYWKPKSYTIPRTNGSFMELNTDILLKDNINYLDYVNDQGIKCIGVDLVRRDQYKFINFYHLKVLENDLRLIMRNDQNEWELINQSTSMIDVVDDIIESFKNIIESYNQDKIPEIPFNITDFVRTGTYKPGKRNNILPIVNRIVTEVELLEEQGEFELANRKRTFIPKEEEKVSYLIVKTEEVEERQLKGMASSAPISEHAYTIQEIEANSKRSVLKTLDAKHYLSALIKSMAQYIIGDKYPDDIKNIEQGTMTENDAKKKITELQDKASKEYIEKYFKTGRSLYKDYKESVTNYRLPKIKNKDLYPYTKSYFINVNTNEEIIKNKIHLLHKTESELEKINIRLEPSTYVYKNILTTTFAPYFETQVEQQIYNEYKNKPKELLKIITELNQKLHLLTEIRKELN